MSIYELYDEFILKFLIKREDFLSGSNQIVLTEENVRGCFTYFLDNPIEDSKIDFKTKLHKQFKQTGDNTKIVFAHASWLYALGAADMKDTGRKESVKMCLPGMDSYALRNEIFLNRIGVGDTGMLFALQKYPQISFIIFLFKWLIAYKQYSDMNVIKSFIVSLCLYGVYHDDKYLLPSIPNEIKLDIKSLFAKHLAAEQKNRKLPIYNILLNLSEPEYYERIISYDHKMKIDKALSPIVKNLTPDMNVDDRLSCIKRQLMAMPEYKNHDPWTFFYSDEIRPLWEEVKPAKPNYWLFQGNPNVFDIVGALNSQTLENWTVTAHRDRIKKGDKVIIWMSGSKRGCYGLAEVTSQPAFIDQLEKDYIYWKEKPGKKELKAGINILNNLADKPILWDDIKEHAILKELNAGNQGTNFMATKAQFEALENIAGVTTGKKYWLFTPGQNGELWDEFFNNSIMAIGFDELGDLSKFKTKEDIAIKLQELEQTSSLKINDALANFEFKEKISIGDVIIAKKGFTELLGYGLVESDYNHDDQRDSYKSWRKVRWIKKGNWDVRPYSCAVKVLTDATSLTTVHSNYELYYKLLMDVMEGKIQLPLKTITPITLDPPARHHLNTILYGPPGTGKTYHTIDRALEIIGVDVKEKTREERKDIFNNKVRDGQIVFTTFHQSMSYEDFIEGIKPCTRADGTISYEVVPGIFKRLCDVSSQRVSEPSCEYQNQPTSAGLNSSMLNDQEFNRLFEDYLEILPYDSETEHSKVILNTQGGHPFDVYRAFNKATIIVRAGSMRTPSSMSAQELLHVYRGSKKPNLKSYEQILLNEILTSKGRDTNPIEIGHQDNRLYKIPIEQAYEKLCLDLSSLSEHVMKVSTPNGTKFGISLNSRGNLNVHTAPEYKLSVTITKENLIAHATGGEVPPYDKGYFLGVLNLLSNKYGYKGDNEAPSLPANKVTSLQQDNYVIIIDEINRGNISKIFGELLTLIEEDKRLGNPEELKVKLPYSNEDFGVPANLYIIGTMNSADRSIALIDLALRRRFVFEDMQADPEIITNTIPEVNMKELLLVMNQRIEILLDRDHALGHAYFMSVRNYADLCDLFSNKIIPLLQEYFYDNWENIRLVLADNQVAGNPDLQLIQIDTAINPKKLFKNFEDEDVYGKLVYKINPKLKSHTIDAGAFTKIYV